MNTELIDISNLQPGDIFSFRTIKRPIWWRFLRLIGDRVTYTDVKDSGYEYTTPADCNVLKKLVPTKVITK